MPEFRTPLTAEELARRRSVKTTRVDLEPYVNYLQTIPEGGAGDVKLTDGEHKPTIKRRVTLAASRVGKTVKYLRSSEQELVFQVGRA